MDRVELKLQLKQHMIRYLNLLEKTPQDIADDMPLFGEGLGLDSIDSLELAVLLEREYNIKITDPKEGRKIFVNVNTIVDYILQRSN
ncbi:MAG: acyl carrier protein [Bacteroidia bacterium]|nr:acyl carrier protein [Bacteroidia bacterium]